MKIKKIACPLGKLLLKLLPWGSRAGLPALFTKFYFILANSACPTDNFPGLSESNFCALILLVLSIKKENGGMHIGCRK